MGFARTRGLCLALASLFLLATAGSAVGEGWEGAGSRSSRNVRSSEREKRGPRPDSLTTARRSGRLSKAEYSLERARSLFELSKVRDEYGRVRPPGPHDGTMVMRDLALSLPRLSGADAREARRILGRPTDGSKDKGGDGYTVPKNKRENKCFDSVVDSNEKFGICLHWVTASKDKARQSYVKKAISTLKVVGSVTLRNDIFNFRSPKPDLASKNHGPNGNLDVYLADLGGQGVYGYCTTDQPKAAKKQAVSAFCVLDNDYSSNQFNSPPPEVSGLDALKITATHEFFHAVQFAYDWKEARWLMEGSAVQMEDEIYDEINAYLSFVEDSAYHQPEIPLDAFSAPDDGENFEYGSFLFFRFMSEYYCRQEAGPPHDFLCSDPELIRRVFDKASLPGVRALSAVKTVVDEANLFNFTDFPLAFSAFGAFNYASTSYYIDGALFRETLGETGPPPDALYDLQAETDETISDELLVDHLATRYVVFRPGAGQPNDATLKLELDLPPEGSGAEASLVVIPSGAYYQVEIDENGNGLVTDLEFDRGQDYVNGDVQEVVLVLSNAGNLDARPFKYTAEANLVP